MIKKIIMLAILVSCGKVPPNTSCVSGDDCHTQVERRTPPPQCDASVPGQINCGGNIYPTAPGKDGLNSLITTKPFQSDKTVCSSGSGYLLSVGLDTNRNGILDPEEASTSVICNGRDGVDGKNATCSVEQDNDGATVSCSDGSLAVIKDGALGQTGAQGLAGAPGASCSVSAISGGQKIVCGDTVGTVLNGAKGDAGSSCSTTQTASGATINCTNGTTATLLNGSVGATGATGAKGDTGIAGTSCTVSPVSTGSKITCGNTSSIVTNGINGINGTNGTNGVNGTNATAGQYDIVKVITPCGANSSPYKEVLLLLRSGDLLADFSDDASGKNTRLAFIPNGGFVDTDESNCSFSVSNQGVSRVVSWSAGHNEYSTWSAGSISVAP